MFSDLLFDAFCSKSIITYLKGKHKARLERMVPQFLRVSFFLMRCYKIRITAKLYSVVFFRLYHTLLSDLSLIFITVCLFTFNMLPLKGEIQKAKPRGKKAEGKKCSHILYGFSVRIF